MPYKDKDKQREADKRYQTKRLERVKQTVLEMYGGACETCGYDNPIALQLDHIVQINRKAPGESGSVLWTKVANGKLPKSMFNLLCANCHAIKTYGDVQNKKLRGLV